MWRIIGLPLIVSFVFAIGCYWAAGPSLGLFLGTLVGTVILTPAMVMREEKLLSRLLVVGAIVDGAAIVWLAAMIWGPVRFGQFLACYVIVAAFSLALAGAVVLLGRLGSIYASAITVVIALAWLTWPVWLAAALHSKTGQRWAEKLIDVSPVFAINSALPDLGIWTERAIAYRITNLNQDVAYRLPAVWPCVAFHALLGAVLLWAGSAGKRWAFRSTSQIEKSASADSKE